MSLARRRIVCLAGALSLLYVSSINIDNTEYGKVNMDTIQTIVKDSIQKETARIVKLNKEKAETAKKKSKPKSEWVSLGTFVCTYYGMDITNATSTGSTPIIGRTIGVDPNVIPYHSEVMIDGNVYVAEDTGNYSGNRIDILCESEAYASELGVLTTEVFIKVEED